MCARLVAYYSTANPIGGAGRRALLQPGVAIVCNFLARLPDGSERTCGQCSECRERRLSDLVGRCIAEQRDPVEPPLAFAVDLTYRDEVSAVDGVERKEIPVSGLVLRYGDIDKLVEKMKNTNWKNRRQQGLPKYSVRFLVAGEYGPLKGRAHWHVIFFIRGMPGEDVTRFLTANRRVSREGAESARPGTFGERVHWKYWPHGFSWLKRCDIATVRYCVKYALKPEYNSDSSMWGYSKKANYSKFPPLGTAYFADLARRHVEQGLAIHDNSYSFRDISGRGGVPWKFFLTHKSLERYLSVYVEEWARVWGGLPPLTPFLVERYFDPIAKEEALFDTAALALKLERKRRGDPLLGSRRVQARSAEVREVVDVQHVATLLLAAGGVAAGYSDGTLSIGYGEGEPARVSCGGQAGAEAFGLRLGLRPGEARSVGEWWRDRVVPLLDPEGALRPVVELGDVWEPRG